MAEQQGMDFLPGEDAMTFDQMWFGQATRVEWDNQGRILIPEKVFKRTAIGKEVSLVGMRDHLELWNRVDWATREEELDRQRVEYTLRARQARQMPPRE